MSIFNLVSMHSTNPVFTKGLLDEFFYSYEGLMEMLGWKVGRTWSGFLQDWIEVVCPTKEALQKQSFWQRCFSKEFSCPKKNLLRLLENKLFLQDIKSGRLDITYYWESILSDWKELRFSERREISVEESTITCFDRLFGMRNQEFLRRLDAFIGDLFERPEEEPLESKINDLIGFSASAFTEDLDLEGLMNLEERLVPIICDVAECFVRFAWLRREDNAAFSLHAFVSWLQENKQRLSDLGVLLAKFDEYTEEQKNLIRDRFYKPCLSDSFLQLELTENGDLQDVRFNIKLLIMVGSWGESLNLLLETPNIFQAIEN